jgi:hypothetical protein
MINRTNIDDPVLTVVVRKRHLVGFAVYFATVALTYSIWLPRHLADVDRQKAREAQEWATAERYASEWSRWRSHPVDCDVVDASSIDEFRCLDETAHWGKTNGACEIPSGETRALAVAETLKGQ